MEIEPVDLYTDMIMQSGEKCAQFVEEVKLCLFDKALFEEDNRRWVTLPQLSSYTNLSFEQAKEKLTTLIRLGFAIEAQKDNKWRYSFIDSDVERVQNLYTLYKAHKDRVEFHLKELDDMQKLIKMIDPEGLLRKEGGVSI